MSWSRSCRVLLQSDTGRGSSAVFCPCGSLVHYAKVSLSLGMTRVVPWEKARPQLALVMGSFLDLSQKIFSGYDSECQRRVKEKHTLRTWGLECCGVSRMCPCVPQTPIWWGVETADQLDVSGSPGPVPNLIVSLRLRSCFHSDFPSRQKSIVLLDNLVS